MSAKRKAPSATLEQPRLSRDLPSHESRITNHDLPTHASRVTRHELQAWGEEFGRSLGAPVIVAIEGELGAGKTTLAQSICRGVGIREDVTSPTFALVNEYHTGDRTVYHLDLYRLTGPEDLTNLAWDDIVNSGEIVLVEWPDRAGNRMPDGAIRIRLDHIADDENHRRLRVG